MSWHQGYVTQLQYTHGFYRELTPSLLAFVQLIRGARQPVAGGTRMSYCELGCGQGFSTNLLAAANPDIDFHANDFNPGQIAGARRLAAESALANVHFHEHSFADLAAEPTLPEAFDIIALHGIYSWISAENRRHILAFVRERLRPGGLVYVSYNTLPGWAAAMPLRRLLVDRSDRTAGTLVEKIDGALAFVERLREVEGSYFKQTTSLAARLDVLKKASRNYLAHEYLNSDWAPEYFGDVAADFGDAKCEYLGSAHILDHIDGLSMTPEMEALLAEESDPIARQSLRDFLVNQEFRRDVFSKGIEQHTPPTSRLAWQEARFALSTPRGAVPMKVSARRGEITLKPEIYDPILDALASGPKTAAQMLAQPAVAALGWNSLQQGLLVLIGTNQVQPCLAADKDKPRSRSTRAFNAAVMRRAETSNELAFLASPVTGGGISVDRFTQLFLSALQQNRADPVQWVWSLLEGQGQRILKDDKTLQSEKENIAELESRLQSFNEEKLPIYRQLGIA